MRAIRKSINLFTLFALVIFFTVLGIGRVFSAFGVDAGAILQEHRIKIVVGAFICIVALSLIQAIRPEPEFDFFVKVAFTGTQRKAPFMELNLRAKSEEQAREDALAYAFKILGQDGLLGCVNATVAECRRSK